MTIEENAQCHYLFKIRMAGCNISKGNTLAAFSERIVDLPFIHFPKMFKAYNLLTDNEKLASAIIFIF